MVKDELPYVKRVIRKNKKKPDAVYYYSVTPGLKRVKIPYPFGTVKFYQFVKDRNASVQSEETAIPGTVRHLADLYQENRLFKRLAPKTQQDYRNYIKSVIAARLGAYQVCDVDVEVISALHDSFIDRPRVGNQILSIMSAMFKVAIKHKSVFGIDLNPCREIQRFGSKEGIKPRRQVWDRDTQKAFLDKAMEKNPQIYKGFMLMVYTGQRVSDCLKMDIRKHYDGSHITVKQGKTGAELDVKAHKDLVPILEKELKAANSDGVVSRAICWRENNEPYDYERFRKEWDAIAEEIGITNLKRQDLRRTAVVRLAEAGCTIPEIAAITGHSLKQVTSILETYLVRNREMGDAAILKLEAFEEVKKGMEKA